MSEKFQPGGLIKCLRVMALLPFILIHLIASDLTLRLLIATGSHRHRYAFISHAVRSMTYLLSVGLNWKFKLDPRLAQLAGQPSCTIVVANHHSPLDIYVLMHALAANPPHFICRPGLERGLPFISLYVRHACAVLTGEPERNDALISLLGKRVAASNGVAILFPEGRKNAKNYASILPFMPSGLDKLVAAAPDARVVAVAIKGTHAAWPGPWKLPKPGAVIEVLIADPVQTDLAKHTQLARQCETAIRRTLASAAANVPRAEAP